MVHLADADNDKPSMRNDLGASEPACAMARVAGAEMQHADHQKDEQA